MDQCVRCVFQIVRDSSFYFVAQAALVLHSTGLVQRYSKPSDPISVEDLAPDEDPCAADEWQDCSAGSHGGQHHQ